MDLIQLYILNSKKWKILDTGKADAAKNMAIDAQLLKELDDIHATPTLHLYDWQAPSITYGHFTQPNTLVSLDAIDESGIQIARRPTGGGLLLHTIDWTFSLLIPAAHPAYSVNTLNNYAFVNHLILKLVQHFTGLQPYLHVNPVNVESPKTSNRYFCMAMPTTYDVMIHGKKLAGGAQRRTRFGFLHQGTVSLTFPEIALLEKILLKKEVKEAMLQNTAPLLGAVSNFKEVAEARKALSVLLQDIVLNQL